MRIISFGKAVIVIIIIIIIIIDGKAVTQFMKHGYHLGSIY